MASKKTLAFIAFLVALSVICCLLAHLCFFKAKSSPPVFSPPDPDAKKYPTVIIDAGHGGMDGIMFREFINAYREGREMPIDVYDCAAWMCITALSAQSIAMGGAPQAIPDFTSGKWILREPRDVVELVKPEK